MSQNKLLTIKLWLHTTLLGVKHVFPLLPNSPQLLTFTMVIQLRWLV